MKSAKKCVTTYLPNESALKMDGAKAYYLYLTIRVKYYTLMSRRTWRL